MPAGGAGRIDMSTTKSQERRESEVEGFRDVQSYDDVCGNCFRRTHYTFERNYAVDVLKVDDFEWITWARKIDAPDRSYPVKENRTHVPKQYAGDGTVGCCVCGYPPGEQLRPLPKKLFFEYAAHLVGRYSEFGLKVDVDVFFEELEERKTDPSSQFADDRIYEKSTDEAMIQ